jgi:hypothetical protein
VGISKWNAGVIRPVAVAPTGPYQNSAAPGVWTLDQQAYWQKQGLWPTAGNLPPVYIEDVFSTYLYTGNGSTQTITNGIDLAGKGGLTWIKSRSAGYLSHVLFDTVRGNTKRLYSNLADAEETTTTSITSFNSNGFSIGSNALVNESASTFASWTFREQPKFFDVVTYTGNGSARTIAHNLGSVPGCIIVKNLSSGIADWQVYHRSLSNTQHVRLNTTAAVSSTGDRWNSTTPTSTVFSIGTDTVVNGSGDQFVAYLFAHDAGGFGLTGNDNVISCGTFTTDGSGAAGNITLGYESQWVLVKRTDGAGSWFIVDTMRGSSLTSYNYISPNTANAETPQTSTQGIYPTATGFYVGDNLPTANGTYIYIAIRRGPMKVPTTGTSVFSPNTYTGTGATLSVSGLSFPPDMVIPKWRSNGGGGYSTRPGALYDKLRGVQQELAPTSTAAESTQSTGLTSFNQSGFTIGTSSVINSSPDPYISWNFQRSPSVFDVVCYTGDGTTGRQVSHGLAAIPEMIILKQRNGTTEWTVYQKDLGTWAANSPYTLYLQTTTAKQTDSSFIGTAPSSTSFPVSSAGVTNTTSGTYVTYLFATCAGVSKIGSYTGTGALQTVNCGFASGARFVLIKRTDSTGAWYVWDSARGISSGNDPYLLMNSTAAEDTGTNYVDTTAVGFQVTAAAPAALNASGGTYIFLAIA